MLEIHRELAQLFWEYSFNKYLLSPIWVLGIMLSTKAFMDVGPHLWHVTNPTGHTQGTLILGEHCLHLYVVKGLGENFIKKYMSKTCYTMLSMWIPLLHVHMKTCYTFSILLYSSMLKKYSYILMMTSMGLFPSSYASFFCYCTVYTNLYGANYL